MLTVTEAMSGIETAACVLRMMPRVGVKNRFCAWPDFIRSYWETYGSDSARDNLRVRLTSKAGDIDTMDRALGWLIWLAHDHPTRAKILWARAEKFPWREIGKVVGKSHTHCQHEATIALVLICAAVNQKKIRTKKITFQSCQKQAYYE